MAEVRVATSRQNDSWRTHKDGQRHAGVPESDSDTTLRIQSQD